MALVEITCPFCNSLQKVVEQRLAEPVMCMKCQQVIQEPFQHKVAPAQMSLNVALKGKLVTDFGTTQLEQVESKADAYTGRKTSEVKPEPDVPAHDDFQSMGTVSEYTNVSSSYTPQTRTRVLSSAQRTYIIGGLLIVILLIVATGIGLALMEEEKEREDVEAMAGAERLERHPNGLVRLKWHVKQLPTGEEVMDGQWQEFYADGNKKGLGLFVEGKEVGIWQTWHNNGQLMSTGKYVDGLKDGTWEEFHPDGSKAALSQWQAGVQVGEARRWYHDGKAESVMRFKDGKIDGDWLEWHENGEQKWIYTHQAGRKVGTWRRYYDNAKPQSEETFVDGLPQGPAWANYRNGSREYEGAWQAGVQTGAWTWWYPNGNKKKAGAYVEGRQDGPWEEWHENGNPRIRENFAKGVREGLWEEFWADGTLAARREYKDGVGGPETLYFGGEVVLRRTDRDASGTPTAAYMVLAAAPETRHGPYRSFHADGTTVAEEGDFVNGKRHGLWKYFNAQGEPATQKRFDNGNEIG